MGSAYRLHRRTCYTKKEPPRRISEVLKVAATCLFYVPRVVLGVGTPRARNSECHSRHSFTGTTQCSTIGDAVSLCPVPSPPLSAPLLSRLCPLSLPRPRAVGAHSPHPTPSATADTARASEAGLTTPELRLYRPTT